MQRNTPKVQVLKNFGSIGMVKRLFKSLSDASGISNVEH